MKQQSHIVIYKDHQNALAMYFGPFVSAEFASDFVSNLPTPLKGGFKKQTVTQPFTYNETRIVNDLIMVGREKLNA